MTSLAKSLLGGLILTALAACTTQGVDPISTTFRKAFSIRAGHNLTERLS